jgi:hypothetical protein
MKVHRGRDRSGVFQWATGARILALLNATASIELVSPQIKTHVDLHLRAAARVVRAFWRFKAALRAGSLFVLMNNFEKNFKKK